MSSELDKAKERGADLTRIAKLVEVSGLGDVVAELKDLALVQQIANTAQTKILISAIDRLVDTINEKEFNDTGTDVSGLVEAVKALKMEVIVQHEPHDWVIGEIDRDQRGLMKGNITLKALPRVVN